MRNLARVLWCSSAAILGTWVNRHATWWEVVTWGVVYGLIALGFMELLRREPSPQVVSAPSPLSRPLRSRAYLVLHIDITQSPPVATFACIYSASAQDLTRFGRESKADLYRVEADTFTEAHDELEQIVPLYFPWVVPLMTRNR